MAREYRDRDARRDDWPRPGPGGQAEGGPPFDLLAAEADSLAQAVYIMNSGVSRRISMRHICTVIVGEALARQGLQRLWAEMRIRRHGLTLGGSRNVEE
ncbi:MAG: hypothetical protein ACOY94_02995 [Bacillota bacterium]